MDLESTASPNSSGNKVVTRKWLYSQMKQCELSTLDEKLLFLSNRLLSIYGHTQTDMANIKRNFRYFQAALKQKWNKAHRKEDIFLKHNEKWLNGTFELPAQSPIRPGRPSKSFEEASERTKRRKTEEVRSAVDENMIVHAAQATLRARGLRDASALLKNFTKSPTRATKYKRALMAQQKEPKIVKLSPQAALEMFVNGDFTRNQYETVRNTNPSIYPSYDQLLQAKKECYPPQECVSVTSTSAECNIQSLVDVTIKRLALHLQDVLLTLNEKERGSLTLICKWGCDGSQQVRYKQKLDNPNESDDHILLSSFVPIQLTCGKAGKKVVWQNPLPSSPRFCRPIRFRFIKETADTTREEIEFIDIAFKNLITTCVTINEVDFKFQQIFKMTMIDGKVCNAAMNIKSTSRCFICHATSKDFNNLEKKNEINPKALEFGLSVLHARIRLLESILHLAYKLPVKKYRKKRTTDEIDLEEKTKKDIQTKFRNETGLLIDMAKEKAGNTNDGNTSRRFFQDPKLAAEITGVDFNLINRLKVILEVISSGFKIDRQKYDNYAFETAQLYVQLYEWHPMTPTMHKLLIHGGEIIENALLPIGQLSEEAQEARNKHFRSYRENYARKFSRKQCNEDIYNRLLLSSDPLISSNNLNKKKRKSMTFSSEAMELLLAAETNEEDTDVDDVNESYEHDD